VQAHYAAAFEREYGCTEAEWLGWLPAACGGPEALRLAAPGRAEVAVAAAGRFGQLHLAWHALPPRRIALVVLPRLAVAFRFEQLDDAARHAFMKRFDLYMQRGGG
jgi:hypothetical protein